MKTQRGRGAAQRSKKHSRCAVTAAAAGVCLNALPVLLSQRCGRLVPTLLHRGQHSKLGTSAVQQRTVPRAMPSSSVTTEQWWKKDGDLWAEAHSVEEFQQQVLNADLPVVVDWYASWCHGCQRSYPEICKVLKLNPDLRKAFKFVKVCVDDVPKAFSRDQGVTALPRMGLYRPGHGRVVTWDVPLSRVKHLKQAEAKRKEAIAELESKSGTLFERLRAVASGGLSSSPKPGSTPPAAPAPPAASNGSPAAPPPPPQHAAGAAAAAAGVAGPPTWALGLNGGTNGAVDLEKAAEEYKATFAQQFGQMYLLDKQMFLNRYGSEYGYDNRIDGLYPSEVGVRMGPLGPAHRQQHYMDYTGASVYTQSQLRAAFQELASTMFGNPHAQNPSSELSTQRIDEVRSVILKFFNADPSEWQLVFTRSATGALKMVGETFPWSQGSLFRYLRENHNSVLGVREYALAHGAAFQAVDEGLMDEWLSAPVPSSQDSMDTLASKHDHAPSLCTGITALGECGTDWGVAGTDADGTPTFTSDVTPAAAPAAPRDASSLLSSSATGSNGSGSKAGAGTGVARLAPARSAAAAAAAAAAADGEEEGVTYSLMAFPAEDNFAGVKYPLSWAAKVKQRSTADHKWMVLIDAAAYVPTQPLNLSEVQADFVDIAFYKLFGYPTGLGALLVRTEAVPLLRKVFWGGGSVALASSRENFHVLKCRPSDKLEDGTVSFLDIISLQHGFNMISNLGGISRIQSHVASLTEWTYEALTKLRHSNGKHLVKAFGKHTSPRRREVQGGILNFELRDPSGRPHSYRAFEREASAAGFHLRTGAECNPGACYSYLGVSDAEVEQLAGVKEGCDDEVEFITVQRPAAAPAEVHSSDTLRLLSGAQRLALGHPAEVASKWVQVPLGSVRVSLGWMSTFEDCWALADFISRTYRNREAEELPVQPLTLTAEPATA